MAKVLIVDDDENICRVLKRVLETASHEVVAVGTYEDAMKALSERNFELVFLDIHLPDKLGNESIKELLVADPILQIIIITADLSIEKAVQSIKCGAADYITKPFTRESILFVMENVLKDRRSIVEKETKERNPLYSLNLSSKILGTSKKMCHVNIILHKVAQTPSTPVLIQGESGTGKELAAQAIHHQSARKDAPMIKINCSAIPRPLVESELFGHESGAFTDARSARKGLFELADGGTVFLDEVGELDLSVQPKLLRVLEDKTITRVGGGVARPVDIRVVAATNRDLQAMCNEGTFRKDLYFRLAVMNVKMPPLRDHMDDIEYLADTFLREKCVELGRKISSFSETVMKFFISYSWPGNVRELKNMIERLIILTEGDVIHFDERNLRKLSFLDSDEDDLSDTSLLSSISDSYGISSEKTGEDPSPVNINFDGQNKVMKLAEVEKLAIIEALSACEGNKTLCANQLGISRSTLQRKIAQYEIESDEEDESVIASSTNQ